MFKQLVPIIIAVAIAIAGGIYSADWLTREFAGFGALKYGAWVAHPQTGTSIADPYARARAARTGEIALGSAEGLVFIAHNDDSGDILTASCDYEISGKTPSARTWTLRITDAKLLPLNEDQGDQTALHAGNILRDQDHVFQISVSKQITTGNWLAQSGSGERRFVLTLYDTSVASTTGVSEIKMPSIKRTRCANE